MTNMEGKISELILKVTIDCSRPLNFTVQHQQKGRTEDSDLPEETIAIYLFFYEDECLKVGQVGKNSKARFRFMHYKPKSCRSNLARSILDDVSFSRSYHIHSENVQFWLKKNTERYDVLINSTHDKHRDKIILNFLEGLLQYEFQPRYEG